MRVKNSLQNVADGDSFSESTDTEQLRALQTHHSIFSVRAPGPQILVYPDYLSCDSSLTQFHQCLIF